ncbi:MAG TPA: DegV family protein [Acidimicrobiales bacterium]|nr:DegV family protein [Acidimicrobiales bacterium]
MGVRIVTDSACDLPDEIAAELGIVIVPLTIRFGADEFVDRRDLSPEDFWKRCAASPVLPETAAPAPGQFEAAFRGLVDDGATGIVCVSLSSAMSATMQSAQVAANALSSTVPIEVVDSRSATLGLGMIAVDAAERARDGGSAAEVAEQARDLTARSHVWGALDTLENLRKGGRIGGAKAMLASVLSIKPIIEVRDGRVEEGGKQRTRSKALQFLVDKVRAAGPLERLAVLQADAPDVDAFVTQLQPLAPAPIVVGHVGPVVGTHAGRGAIGVVWHSPR